MRSLSYKELQTLCNVNHETEVAFLAVTGPRENEVVVGSGCYFLNPTTNLAEVAFMVAPEWQGAGLGTALQIASRTTRSAAGCAGSLRRSCRATRPCCGSRVVCRAGDYLAGRGCGARQYPIR